jgi:ubiquinone/menaquinone biosynthesis C-methylase UbiE
VPVNPTLQDGQNWDDYWDQPAEPAKRVYSVVAGIYRHFVIKRNLEYFVKKHFCPGSSLIHAGCGSGQVDTALQTAMQITAVDISTEALKIYLRNNPDAHDVKHASVFELPAEAETFDGIYNLGVVEHFSHAAIGLMLREFHRVLKQGGKIVIFWPHRRATSVVVLGVVHRLLNDVLKTDTRLHPPEISLLKSRREAAQLLRENGFCLKEYYFGARDLFVQAVVVGEKVAS